MRFTYDINGLLEVEVVNETGHAEHLVLQNKDMSPQEVERRLKELARLLREQRLASSIDAVYERYAHTDLLEGCLPIYLMNTVGNDHACVLLKMDDAPLMRAGPLSAGSTR